MKGEEKGQKSGLSYLLVGCGCLAALIGVVAVVVVVALSVLGNQMNTLFSEVATELEAGE